MDSSISTKVKDKHYLAKRNVCSKIIPTEAKTPPSILGQEPFVSSFAVLSGIELNIVTPRRVALTGVG